MQVVLEVAGLHKSFGGLEVLKGIDLKVAERELVFVIGPSGSGKSTLLNALTGFRPADSGHVVYNGRDVYATYESIRMRIS